MKLLEDEELPVAASTGSRTVSSMAAHMCGCESMIIFLARFRH
jgi:hypothetical protein